jgi:hypothetical protein
MPGLIPRPMVFNTLNNVQLFTMVVENNNPHHTLVAFTYFVLHGFLQLKHPQNPTPFEIHPKTTFVSIVTFLAYCLLFWVRLKFAIHVNTLMEIFGSLSLISLLLMLLPSTWGLYGFIIIYTLWFIFHVLAMIRSLFIRTSSKMRRRSQPLLPNTWIDLN